MLSTMLKDPGLVPEEGIEAAKEMLEGCRGFCRKLGRAFASSGLRVCHEGYPQD